MYTVQITIVTYMYKHVHALKLYMHVHPVHIVDMKFTSLKLICTCKCALVPLCAMDIKAQQRRGSYKSQHIHIKYYCTTFMYD